MLRLDFLRRISLMLLLGAGGAWWTLGSPAKAETNAATGTVSEFVARLPERLESLSIEPSQIELTNKYAYSQLLITGRLGSGETVDLTRTATIEPSAGLVEVTPTGFLRPLADGEGTLRVSYGGKSQSIPLKISGVADDFHPSFVRDINPVLGKLGCNAGTCHGSKDGKNGFKLSLRGYDPLYDHRALTDDVFARRFNRAAPEQSLMLLKPTGVVPHQGGVLMTPGEPYYELLRLWIADGVKLDLDSPRVSSIEVQPSSVTIPLPEMSQQMKVIATYSDGTRRDVTAEAFIEPSDIEVLSINPRGLITAIRRGEAAALARFEGAYAAAPIYVMGDRTGYEWSGAEAYNNIDELVYAKQRRVKVLPGEVCGDAEFLRRVSLDLTGLPPTADEVLAFMADERPTRVKRDELVDRLIGSEAYVDFWTNKWADMLQVNPKFLGEPGAKSLRDWIRGSVAENKPYNQFAYEVLSASGSNMDNPPAAYYKRYRTAEDLMENTTQLFLAIRFNCNKCHDHPFERWTQDQYYHLAAYFAQVERKPDDRHKGEIQLSDVDGKVPLVEIIGDAAEGEVKHERTGEVVPPSFPYEFEGMPPSASTRREHLALWLTSKDNPYFARSYVNRVWSYLLGVGLIEPVDDVRAGNPPTNPELLNYLTERFIASNFDVRALMTEICKSRTYQLSLATNKWNDGDTLNYARALPRRLSAEVLYDALHRATGSESHLPGLPPGSRAVAAIDPGKKLPDAFMDLFGRPPRESACECERTDGVLLGPVMNLIMGPTINDAIADPKNSITHLVMNENDDAKVVEQLFLSILNRPPTSQELQAGLELFRTPLAGVELDEARAEMARHEQQLNERQAEWEQAVQGLNWEVVRPESFHSHAGATLELKEDGSILVGDKLDKDQYIVNFHIKLGGITGFRIEALADESLPGGGPGRAKNGNFVLTELKILDGTGNPLSLQNPQADFNQDIYRADAVLDGNPDTGWGIHPETGRNHALVVETVNDLGAEGADLHFSVRLSHDYIDKKHALGRFRISVTKAPRPLVVEALPADLAAILQVANDQRSPEQQAALTAFYRRNEKQLGELQALVRRLETASQNPRLVAAQDLAWALVNSPAFLFNH